MKDFYHEGYFERGEGSNYHHYGDDDGWDRILNVLSEYRVDYPNGVLLEVACAKGYFVAHALDWGWDAYGFDISDYAISRSVVPDRTAVHDATEPWLFASDDAVDILVSWEFFEHVDAWEIDAVWTEMLRVTKPGGLIVLKIGMPNGERDVDITHVTMQDRDWWEDRLVGRVDPLPDLVAKLDAALAGRDWAGRFFAWRRR